MRKIEFKKFVPGSVFKGTIYLMTIPMALMGLIGIIMIFAGMATGEGVFSAMGVGYLIFPLIGLVLYGGIAALMSLIYNGLAGKFGGIEVYIKEDTDNIQKDNVPTDDIY